MQNTCGERIKIVLESGSDHSKITETNTKLEKSPKKRQRISEVPEAMRQNVVARTFLRIFSSRKIFSPQGNRLILK